MKVFTILYSLVLTGMLVVGMMALDSCKHEPILPTGSTGSTGATGATGMTGPTGSTGSTGWPCDPDSVYFFKDVLPLLQANCAQSGCHDAISAKDGVILDSYANVLNTADVRPGNPGDSDLYEVLTETDPSKIMPPPPASPLPADRIALIRKWIDQGAQDLKCNPNYGGCDTTDVSFSVTIKPELDKACLGCHQYPNPGGGIVLDTYVNVKSVVDNGKLLGAIRWDTGFKAMPQGGSKMDSCYIEQLTAWINQGAKNN